jgi:hypothetical protein
MRYPAGVLDGTVCPRLTKIICLIRIAKARRVVGKEFNSSVELSVCWARTKRIAADKSDRNIDALSPVICDLVAWIRVRDVYI